jgi:hypothetical protein
MWVPWFIFRLYVSAYMRPSGTPCVDRKSMPLSLHVHDTVVAACQRIHDGYESWLSQNDHRICWGNKPSKRTNRLCGCSLINMASSVTGLQGSRGIWKNWCRPMVDSRHRPGWVRAQCVHLMRFVLKHIGHDSIIQKAESGSIDRCHFTQLVVPYVDAAYVADQFNRYRKSQKVYTQTGASFPTQMEQNSVLEQREHVQRKQTTFALNKCRRR